MFMMPPNLPSSSKRRPRLTPREKEVLHWIGKGKTNGELAAVLGISPRTVEKHVENILGKLGVENRTAAVMAWMRGRWQVLGGIRRYTYFSIPNNEAKLQRY
jgi:DNA-binding CsgD family transcriptional regulator